MAVRTLTAHHATRLTWPTQAAHALAILILQAICIAPATALAQSTRHLTPVAEFEERFLSSEEIPVSGTLRVGVMALADVASLDPTHFYALLPATRANALCVEISSRDGRYEARQLQYQLGGAATGPNRMQLPTRYASELAQYAPDELAILAWLSSDCRQDDPEFVVASWSSITTPDTVAVLLNSNVPAFVVARSANGGRLGEATCQQLTGRLRAYNRRCEVPLAWIREGTLTLRKRERRGSRSIQVSTPLTIRVAPPR